MNFKTRMAAVTAAVALVATPMVATVPPLRLPAPSVTWNTAKVIRWVDGDTVKTSRGTVRLVGVDTPETGRCGASTATRLARSLAPVGSTVRLGNPVSVVNKDRYGRYLRYVQHGTVDIGKRQIMKGARARYDSRDGYQWHPRERSYRSTDSRYRNYRCSSGGTGGGTTGSSWATRVNTPVSGSNPDLDCGQIPSAYKPIRITGPDYHRLDADGDGWGCDAG